MSKLAVFVGVPTAVAVLGLAIWNVQLQSEIEDLRVAAATSTSAGDAPARSGEDSGVRSGTRREEARTRALEDRLRALEEHMVAAPAAAPAAAAAPDDTRALSADLPEMLRHPDFGRAVNEVIDARDEARRQERLARDAEQRTRRMLRDLDVTDAQRDEVLRVTSEYLRGRDEARRALDPDDGLELEARREAARESGRELQDAWTEALAGILDATQMETVRERATQRRAEARRRGRRGSGGGAGSGADGGLR